MNKLIPYTIVLVGVLFLIVSLYGCQKKWPTAGARMITLKEITQPQDVADIFPQTPQELDSLVERGMAQAEKDIQAIINIPAEKRTFDNTMRALDIIISRSLYALAQAAAGSMELVSPSQELREAAHAASLKMHEFNIDQISNNVDLYRVVKEYAENAGKTEHLNPEERYFLQTTLEDFKRAGLDLPAEKLEQVRKLKKEISKLSLEFETNIAKDNSTITVDRAALEGLEEDFINSLKKTADGTYILGVDYPTYFNVKEHASSENTRRAIDEAFNNRAYPKNDEILREVIAKRDELAKLLGFDSYAALDLDDEMAKKPAVVDEFLHELYKKSSAKADQEFERIAQSLPPSVQLTEDGKMKSWDVAYAKEQYKKKHFAVDEQEVAQYFPMEKTIKGLLDIYQQFLSLKFKEVPVKGLWHNDLTVIEAHDVKSGKLLGYLILDLYPRPNKFSHACQVGILPAIKEKDGTVIPSVGIVVANFPPSTATRPSLLRRKDVETFFHEFGHAMHHLLGQTELGSFSGTHVKRDFVEMPSQMLEEWLWDKDILKMISSHYKTGQPLPDELIDKLLELKKFSSGSDVTRQAMLAQLALDYYKPGAQKDTTQMLRDLAAKMLPHSAPNPKNHFQASFGHLMDYAAKYYGYLWSKVFALDLFEAIKHEGLLNPEVGARYVKEVIGRGGSAEPMELLKNFLGREPNQEAFLRDLGL